MQGRALFVRLTAMAATLFLLLALQGVVLVIDGPAAAAHDETAWLGALDAAIDAVLRLWTPLCALVALAFAIAALKLHRGTPRAVTWIRVACLAGLVWAAGLALHMVVVPLPSDAPPLLGPLRTVGTLAFFGVVGGCLLFLFQKVRVALSAPD